MLAMNIAICFFVYIHIVSRSSLEMQIWVCSNPTGLSITNILIVTRTTRMPAFWDTPAAPWLPILTSDFKSKQDKVKVTNFKKLPKYQILKFQHATHLLKFLDKMCEYKMDPTRTVGATERTQDAGRRDGWTDRVKPIYPPKTSLCRGYNE